MFTIRTLVLTFILCVGVFVGTLLVVQHESDKVEKYMRDSLNIVSTVSESLETGLNYKNNIITSIEAMTAINEELSVLKGYQNEVNRTYSENYQTKLQAVVDGIEDLRAAIELEDKELVHTVALKQREYLEAYEEALQKELKKGTFIF